MNLNEYATYIGEILAAGAIIKAGYDKAVKEYRARYHSGLYNYIKDKNTYKKDIELMLQDYMDKLGADKVYLYNLKVNLKPRGVTDYKLEGVSMVTKMGVENDLGVWEDRSLGDFNGLAVELFKQEDNTLILQPNDCNNCDTNCVLSKYCPATEYDLFQRALQAQGAYYQLTGVILEHSFFGRPLGIIGADYLHEVSKETLAEKLVIFRELANEIYYATVKKSNKKRG